MLNAMDNDEPAVKHKQFPHIEQKYEELIKSEFQYGTVSRKV